MASDDSRRIGRSTLLIALLLSLPPGLGMALATLRVTGGDAELLAGIVGLIAGGATFVFVLVLSAFGRPEHTPVHDR